MTVIECTDINGNLNKFEYSYSSDQINGENVLNFSIKSMDQKSYDIFDFAATDINNGTLKVTMMKHYKKDIFIAKGIPEKMIEELYLITRKQIISSTNNKAFIILPEEFRTDSATKVWQRLVNKGKAEYDSEKDLYRLKINMP